MTKHEPSLSNTRPNHTIVPVSFHGFPTDFSRSLVPLTRAMPGDMVVMVSSYTESLCTPHDGRYRLESFWVKTENSLSRLRVEELSGKQSDRAAELIGRELFLGPDPTLFLQDDGKTSGSRSVTILHFADCILRLDDDLLFGRSTVPLPIRVRMSPAQTLTEANDLRWRLRSYLTFVSDVNAGKLPKGQTWEAQTPDVALLLSKEARARYQVSDCE